MVSSISISSSPTSSNAAVQQPGIWDCYLTQKIRQLYQKYVVENPYGNLVFHYFWVGVGLSIGVITVLIISKDVLRDIFQHCMRR
jgi:hypothetical protein